MGMSSSSPRSGTRVKTKPVQQRTVKLFPLRSLSQNLLLKLLRRLDRPHVRAVRRAATESQRRLVLTGLILGFFSIFAAIFPPCGFLISITGLLIGLYGRRTTSLYMMSSWTIALAFCGLLLTLIYSIFIISLYLSHLFLGGR